MKKMDELTDHIYDGIQEYDNDLPRWWVNLFWITVIWGVIYAVWFHLPSTPTPHERLATGLDELKARSAAHGAVAGGAETESQLLATISDKALIEKGSVVFAGKCMACHLAQGQGLVGPNLTDDYWIHGGKATDIKRTILEGVPEKGMVSWKALLTSEEVNAAVAFIWSIHGTNPPNPKAPQGDLVPRQ